MTEITVVGAGDAVVVNDDGYRRTISLGNFVSSIRSDLLAAPADLSMSVAGEEALRVEDPATLAAGETSLWLYDLDNATLVQVQVGANDSGGAGLKALVVPN